MKRKIQINLRFNNRVLYSIIILGVLILITFGVWAFGGNNPSLVGHSAGELDLSAGVNGPVTFKGNVNFWKTVNVKGTIINLADIITAGNVSLTGPGAGIKFPDGTVQKTAAASGTNFDHGGCYWTSPGACSYTCPVGYYVAGVQLGPWAGCGSNTLSPIVLCCNS